MKTYRRCQPVSNIPDATDWDKLFDGGIYQCEEGSDYDCSTSTFVKIVLHKAADRKLTLNLSISEDSKSFVVQRIL